MYCLYIMEKIPSIIILTCKKWKKPYRFFHILYNSVNSMENSKKFQPDTKLRLMESVRLRVKDIDFGRRQIMVHEG